MRGDRRCSHIAFALITLIALGITLAGCAPASAPIQTSTAAPPTATSTPLLPTATPATPFVVRVVSYNILLGGGVEAGHAEQSRNHLADLIQVVREANPDLLGLQEANGWNVGNPPVIDKFAAALNMHAYLAPTWRGFNLALLSKYPILEAENLSDYVGNNGALRAVVEVAPGQKLQVLVVHLDPNDVKLRSCEFDKLRRIMEAHTDAPALLMGDFNTFPVAADSAYLEPGGWELAHGFLIDNILVRSLQAWSAEDMCFQQGTSRADCIDDRRISDHFPVGATITFTEAPNAFSAPLLPTPEPVAGCRYEAAPLETPNDSFGGTQLDDAKWQNIGSQGASVQEHGRLALTPRDAEPSSGTMVRSRWRLQGDFDIQVDFEIDPSWTAPAQGHLDGAVFGVAIDGVQYHLTRLWRAGGGSDAQVLMFWSPTGTDNRSIPTQALAGKYRLTRTGPTLSLQYDVGSGWQELAHTAVTTAPASVYLGNGSVGASEAFTTYFANFLINAGSAIY